MTEIIHPYLVEIELTIPTLTDGEHVHTMWRRLTLEEWEEWKASGICLVRGIRVCEDNPNENGMGYKAGDEREDGESCLIDEFDVEILEIDEEEL